MLKLMSLWLSLSIMAYSFGVDTKIINQTNNKYAITGSIPRFLNKDSMEEGDDIPPSLTRTNEEIESAFNEIKREVISSALEFAEDFPNSNLLPFTLNSSFYFTNNDLNITSLVIETSYYTGGAHPNSFISTYVVDKDNYYTLDNFFKDPEGAKEFILRGIEEEIKRSNSEAQKSGSPKIYFDDVKPNLEDTVFYLEGSKIVIVFQRYSIAPYSSGNPEFRFPLASMSKFLSRRKIIKSSVS